MPGEKSLDSLFFFLFVSGPLLVHSHNHIIPRVLYILSLLHWSRSGMGIRRIESNPGGPRRLYMDARPVPRFYCGCESAHVYLYEIARVVPFGQVVALESPASPRKVRAERTDLRLGQIPGGRCVLCGTPQDIGARVSFFVPFIFSCSQLIDW